MTTDYDVAIVGGGLVGASMACALDQSGLEVALIEAFPFAASGPATYDDRTLALSHQSCRTFRQLGLWPGVESGVTPIEQVQVSSRGQFGQTRITAAQLDLPALGQVVEARLIGQAVSQRLPDCERLTVHSPARLTAIDWGDASARLRLDDGQTGQSSTLSAQLVIGADGTDSVVRELAGLAAAEHDYEQTAIIANVTPGRAHGNVAYERLTAAGPIALLPHVGERCGLVRVAATADAERLLALSDSEFLADAQERFGLRLGVWTRLGRRSDYPLRLVHAEQQYRARAVIIGNAAHTVHNVAAQGFNLGLRDVVALASHLRQAHGQARDLGDPALLAEYQAQRQADQQRVIRLTDGLIRGFAQQFPPIRALRSVGMVLLDAVPPLRREFARRAMGQVSVVVD